MRLAGWVLGLVAVVSCTATPALPGEGDAPTPCAEVLPNCEARRLPNGMGQEDLP
jgi:hypothetical protein